MASSIAKHHLTYFDQIHNKNVLRVNIWRIEIYLKTLKSTHSLRKITQTNKKYFNYFGKSLRQNSHLDTLRFGIQLIPQKFICPLGGFLY